MIDAAVLAALNYQYAAANCWAEVGQLLVEVHWRHLLAVWLLQKLHLYYLAAQCFPMPQPLTPSASPAAKKNW